MTRRAVTISVWEWMAAAVSAVAVLSVIVTLLIAGRRERTPPLAVRPG